MRFFGSIRLVPLACALCSGIQIYDAKAADTPLLTRYQLSASEPQADQPFNEGDAFSKEITPTEDTLSHASTSTTESFELPSTSRADEEDLLVPPTGDDTQATLHDLLSAHFREPRNANDYPNLLAYNLVAWMKDTAELVTGQAPMHQTIQGALSEEDPKAALLRLQEIGAAHLSPPFLQQHIVNMRRGMAAPGRREFWWNNAALEKRSKEATILKHAKGLLKRFRRNSPKYAAQRLRDVCADAKPNIFPTSVLELLLRIDKTAHLILEAAMGDVL
ncbi:hypothetical protein Emag_006607 [Eimeria magna]